MTMHISALREDDAGLENARYLTGEFSRAVSGEEILLSPGRYHIRNQQGDALFASLMSGEIAATDYAAWKRHKNPVMSVRDKTAVTIDGQGAVLSFSGLIQPFAFENCRHLHIRNLRIDWRARPFPWEPSCLRTKKGYW